MDKASHRKTRRVRRKAGIRKAVTGTPSRPRLTVYRSLKHIYVQLVDDLAGATLVSASTRDKGYSTKETGNSKAAAAVGKAVAQKAKAKGIEAVCFDRNGFRYHGRVKALADAAREAGLKF